MSAEHYADYCASLDEWCVREEIRHYCVDGPLSTAYWAAHPRILVLNLESYGYDQSGRTEVAREFPKWIGGLNRTPTWSLAFVAGLRRTRELRRSLDRAELASVRRLVKERLGEFADIAYVNVRKTSNPNTVLDAPAIYKALAGDWLRLLKQQCEALQPQLVITSGYLGSVAANRIFSFATPLAFGGIGRSEAGPLVVSLRHFSRARYADLLRGIDLIVSARLIPPFDRI